MSENSWTLDQLVQSDDHQSATAWYSQNKHRVVLHMHIDSGGVWVIGRLELVQAPEITTNTLRTIPLAWMRTKAATNLHMHRTQAAKKAKRVTA